ncbi:MAG: TetR/AcrR family transcriptional regulator [Bacteriovoracaceae bacterium]|nr:TetR/AcrR family transcriptional regulator [Bacteriovoracaceae bacterium]
MGRTKCFERNEVLDKAIQLFWRKGYSDTSLHDLEVETGVNKSGLYSEFKDKEDIFLESLKRYRDINPVLHILETKPMGLKNIESFLVSGMSCDGQKGCFLANTMREVSIIPPKIKNLMFAHVEKVRNLLIENLKASGIKAHPEATADFILTYSTGLSIKLNVMKPDQLRVEVSQFLAYLKATPESTALKP